MTTIGKLSKFNILQLFQKQNNIKNLLNELKKKKKITLNIPIKLYICNFGYTSKEKKISI